MAEVPLDPALRISGRTLRAKTAPPETECHLVDSTPCRAASFFVVACWKRALFYINANLERLSC